MKKEKWFWGIFFIVAAVILIISKLGILSTGISVWMLFLGVIFAATLIKSILHRSITGVLFSLAFLCIVFAKPLGITALTPWTVLAAALLGSIGISFIYRPKRSWYSHHSAHFDDSFRDIETIEGEEIVLDTSFGSSIKYINSEEFKGVNVRCAFGGMKVYFDHAKVPTGKAFIQMDASFAGVELYVPRNWKVVNQMDASFGGVEEKGRYEADGDVTLVLNGKVSFSGVSVIYV